MSGSDEELTVIGEARVFDRGDGTVPDEQISWASDLDGEIGVGRDLVISASELSKGDHEVTVSATDSSGNADESSFVLRVLREPPVALADLSVEIEGLPLEVAPGDQFVLDVLLRNDGPTTATEAAVMVEIGAGLVRSRVMIDDEACGGEPARCELDELRRGEVVTVEVTVDAPEEGGFEVSAAVSTETLDPDWSDDEATLLVTVAESVEDITPDDPENPGEPGGDDGCGCRASGRTGGALSSSLLALLLISRLRRRR